MRLILASASPRRRALLEQVGFCCEVLPVDIDEAIINGETAALYTGRLAREKAQAGADKTPGDCVVIGADTAICLDGNILGKPDNKAHALAMLDLLAGRRHSVITTFSVIAGKLERSASCSTSVWLAPMSLAQREAYWHSGEPGDKAGAYAIQGCGAVFVERLEGSYSNVVGLPLRELAMTLQAVGVDSPLLEP